MTTPGYSEAEAAIVALFAAEWRAPDAPEQPRTPVDYPNQGQSFEAPTGAAWVRLAVLHGGGFRAAVGPRLDRYGGVVMVQVFVPLGWGTGAATALCDAAGAIFKAGRKIDAGGRLRFRTGSMQVIGGDGRWWQQNVSAPFLRDRS